MWAYFLADFSLYTPTIAVLGCTGASECAFAWTRPKLIAFADFRWLFIPLLHAYTRNDPEQSHRIAVKILGSGLAPIDRTPDQEDVLAFEVNVRALASTAAANTFNFPSSSADASRTPLVSQLDLTSMERQLTVSSTSASHMSRLAPSRRKHKTAIHSPACSACRPHSLL